jgi:capsular polysaccharide biosynthesis protein
VRLLEKARIRFLETSERFVLADRARRKRWGVPRVVETSTPRWFRANRAELEAAGVRLRMVGDRAPIHTALPRCLNGSPSPTWNWAVDWTPQDRFCLELPDARLLFEPWRCSSAVLAPGGTILHDLLPIFFHHARSHPARCAVRLGKPVRLPGKAFLLLNDANSNFYHWMCDVLPRLEIARRAGHRLEDFDWFVTDELSQAFHRESLAALGIPEEKIFVGTRYRFVAAEHLVATSLFDKSGMVHRESLAFVADAMRARFGIEGDLPGHRRIFVSRQEGYYRRIVNWDEIEPLLRKHGFEVVASERLGMDQQTRLFSEAGHVIAGHGAGLTNLMYCRPGTRVLEMLHEKWGHSMYWLTAAKCGLDYTLMKAEPAGKRKAEIDDMLVDPEPLRAYLEQTCGPRL